MHTHKITGKKECYNSFIRSFFFLLSTFPIMVLKQLDALFLFFPFLSLLLWMWSLFFFFSFVTSKNHENNRVKLNVLQRRKECSKGVYLKKEQKTLSKKIYLNAFFFFLRDINEKIKENKNMFSRKKKKRKITKFYKDISFFF